MVSRADSGQAPSLDLGLFSDLVVIDSKYLVLLNNRHKRVTLKQLQNILQHRFISYSL